MSALPYWPHREPANLQDNVSAVVTALLGISGYDQNELADQLGVTPSTISGKMHGRRRWSIDELSQLAAVFGVEPEMFLHRPADIFGSALTKGLRTRRDSNPQPSDLESGSVIEVDFTPREADAPLVRWPLRSVS